MFQKQISLYNTFDRHSNFVFHIKSLLRSNKQSSEMKMKIFSNSKSTEDKVVEYSQDDEQFLLPRVNFHTVCRQFQAVLLIVQCLNSHNTAKVMKRTRIYILSAKNSQYRRRNCMSIVESSGYFGVQIAAKLNLYVRITKTDTTLINFDSIFKD